MREEISNECLNWFNNYNGTGLAKRWLELITEEYNAKT